MPERKTRAAEVRDDIRRWRNELKRIGEEMSDTLQEIDGQASDFLEVAQDCVMTAARVAKSSARRTITFAAEHPDDGHGNRDEE